MSDYDEIFHTSFLFSNNRESPCWFTITLFEFFVAYCAVAYVLTRLRCGLRTKTIVFALPIIAACLLFPYLEEHGFDHTRPTVWAAIGLYKGVNFVSYFCLGVICKLWWPQFMRLVDGRWTSLVCAALFLPFCLYYDIPLHLQLLLSTVSVVMVYSFFHRHPALFCSQTFIGRSLLLFGRHTLAIFLLHWYFILNLRWIHYREWGSFCNEYWFTRLAICLCAAVLISLACIAVSKVWHWAIRVASARGRSFLRLPANER